MSIMDELEIDYTQDFVCVGWKNLGYEESIMFVGGTPEEEIAKVVQTEIIRGYVDYWHMEYTGPLTLKEFAGMTDEEYDKYIYSKGTELGEISYARVNRLRTRDIEEA